MHINIRVGKHHVIALVLCVLFHKERRLYAVCAMVDGKSWYGLIPEDSDDFLSR